MIEPLVLLAFVPVALALNLSPGADMLFCLGQGLRSGARPAVLASAGISTGSMVHVTITGLGLGAAVAALPWLFDVIRWAGVGYLLWLAVSALCRPAVSGGAPEARAGRAFRDGLVVNLTNPKVILFVLAFLPQFIDPARGSVLAQFLILGAVISLGGFVINALVGIFAGSLGRRLTGSLGFSRAIRYATAGIFSALAVRLALIERV